jgi:hypothetical protein
VELKPEPEQKLPELGLVQIQPEPGQLVRTGYAVLVSDKLSSAPVWHTFGKGDKEGTRLLPNESLVIPASAFKIGARVDLYERAE